MLENFKNECKNDAYNNRLGKVVYDDIKEITHNDNLASLELTEDCYVNGNIIGTTNTKSIKINTIGKPNIFNGELENGSIDKDGQNGVSPELDTTTYIELKEKLYSINDVADEYDVVTGKGIKRIGEYIFTGDENISFESNPDSNYIRARFPMDNVSKESKRQPILSNYFKYALSIHDVGTGFISLGYFYFYLPKEYTTKEQYVQWLKDRYNEGNPLKIQYVLETPEEITTEPVNIQLRKGYNKIEIKDKNGLLNKTKLSYLADTEKTVEGTNSIIIDDAEPVNVRSLVVYGNSYQETRSGKNLYNYKDVSTASNDTIHSTSDEDGWITMSYDNTQGTSLVYMNYFCNKMNVKPNTNYNIIIETQEATVSKNVGIGSNDTQTQFNGITTMTIEANKIVNKIATTRDTVDSARLGLRIYMSVPAGENYTFKFRISVLEDTSITPEQFIYEPYGAMPSPEFPSEIKCVEGLGNLFDLDRFIEEYNKVATSPSYKENGFDYFSYGDVSHTGAFAFKFMQGEFKENTQYTLCVKGFVNNYASGNFTGFIFYYTDNTHSEVRLNSGNLSNYTFSSTANKTINYIGLNSSGGKGMFVKDICLYEDNMQLPYLPYGKNYLKLADTGKNLFSSWIKGISFDGNGRQISSTKGAGTDYIPIDFNINQNYTISNITENLALRFYAYNKSKEFIGMSSPNYVNELSFNHDIIGLTSGHTFGEIAYMRFELFQSASVSGNIDEVDNLLTQLEPGDQTTDFEPYIPNKVRNTEKFAIEKSTYTIDLTGATDVYLFFYDENDNLISKSGYHKLPYTFNNTDAKYIRFMFKDVNNDNLDVNDITDIQINDKFSLYGKDVDVNVGVKYDDDSEEYIELGKYTIDKPNDEETVNLGEYKGYDYLDKLNDNYVCSFESFANIAVKDIYSDLCEQVGLAPETLDFENNDIPVTGNIFEEGYKRKEVLSDIAELASSFACINKENNQCCLKTLGKEPVEVITKEDYSLLTKNQKYGPLNCLVIKDSQFEGENVSIQDDDSINENGETQHAIIDNIFLYTPELREQAINKIWESIKGLTYYDCKIESYHGLPYLNAGDKITVEDDNGNYFDTYVLKHTFTYDGTYKSVIESPALTKQETNIKSDVSLKDRLRKTYANVKKAENKIELLTTEVNNNSEKTAGIEITLDGVKQEVDNLSDQSETIVKLQTDVEGIKAQIGSITDVTVNANGIGSITLNNVLTSELLYLQVYPTSEDLSYLNLSPKTYLSNNTKLTSRDLLFINTKTNETTIYTLPCNLYYVSDDVKDELIIDYENKQLMVTHRVGINAETGEKYALSKPTTKLYDYKSIDLIEGNYTIKMQSFNTAYINARALANSIYTAQYATKVEVNNAIKLSEDGIKQEVNGKITSLDGTVKNLKGSLELKLNVKDLCTELNGSADKISFKGNRFSWQSTYSSMSETGTLKATNVDLTGKITASSGTIGGFTITSNSIYKGSNSFGTSGSGNIYLGTNGISISNTFKVTNAGVLSASGATISGTITTSNITATGGTIGGFKLTSSSIYRGSSSFGTSGSGNIYIGTSGISISNAFKVSNAGKLTATNVDLSGKITATSGSFTGTITTSNITATGGKIGGASLNNLGIYFNNGSTGWGLWGTTAHANIVFHAGANSTNIGGAPFRVLHDGTVYASKINIPNGTIAGMTVSNGKFASNRMNLDNTHGSLELYNDGGGKVLFNSGARIAVPAGIMISSKCSGDRSAPSNGDINIIAGMSRSVYLASFSSDRPNSSDYEHQCICITENSVQANWQNIATSSSKATKTNINLLKIEEKEEIYNIVKNLDFYKYDYKEKYSGRKNNYGFLIEDIENTVLETLLHVYKSKNDKNYKNYNCEDLTRIILIIVQELQNKIEKLESKN